MVQRRRRHNHSRRHCSRPASGPRAHRDEGVAAPSLGGSRYLKVCHGLKIGPPPHVDLAHEIKVQNAVRDLIREGLVQSAHDCSEGGLAVTLAESCFNPERLFGAEIDCSRRPMGDVKHAEETNPTDASHSEAATVLFNESQSRIVISVTPENLDNAISMLHERDVPFQQLGQSRRRRTANSDRRTNLSLASCRDLRRVVERDPSRS